MKIYDTEGKVVDADDYLKEHSVKSTEYNTYTRLLGTHGTGKSELFRQLIMKDNSWVILARPNSKLKGKLDRIGMVFPTFKICVVGCYIKSNLLHKCLKVNKALSELDVTSSEVFSTSGGMDGIDLNEVKVARIKDMWHLPYHLIIEGGIISSQDVLVEEIHKEASKEIFQREYLNLLCQPPLEVCLERIMARGGTKEPKTVRPKWIWFENKFSRLPDTNHCHKVKIDSSKYTKDQTIKSILKVLNSIKNNEL